MPNKINIDEIEETLKTIGQDKWLLFTLKALKLNDEEN